MNGAKAAQKMDGKDTEKVRAIERESKFEWRKKIAYQRRTQMKEKRFA